MKRTYTVEQQVRGEFHGERFSGEFALRAGQVTVTDPARAELLEHLVGQGLARRGARKPSSPTSSKPEVTS
jgi:hypothetical protein